MNQMVKFGVILAAICLITSFVLAVTYEATKPKIAEQLKQEEQKALRFIIPEADSFDEKSKGSIDYFEAKRAGDLIGYCVKVIADGYNGYIRLIVGIDSNGIIKGVKVLEHHETPGLGAKIDELRPGETEPWFLRQFKGKPAKTVAIKKDIDAITGATISSKAITDAVNKAVRNFLPEEKDEAT